MKNQSLPPWLQWAARGLLLLALLFGLAFAATPAARAEAGFNTITLYAPGAPASAWVGIQWQDRTGTWHDVEGWQGPISMAEDSDLAFKQWAVYPKDYGRGSFRWIVYNQEGGSVWATSSPFFLPDGDGASLAMSLAPRNAPAVGTAAGGPTLPEFGLSTITVRAPGAPEEAWVGVQWLDSTGAWHDVENWQSALDSVDDSEVAFQTWGVYPTEFGRGPFRWVLYEEQDGAILGTSPRFFLPQGNGAAHTMTILPQITVTPADVLTSEMTIAPLTLPAETSTSGLTCAGQPCNFSVISISVPDAAAASHVGVQWQDNFGLWHDVPTWQASLSTSGAADAAYQQWTIAPELRGHGPFRWVLYNALGDTVVGVTPGFMLPDGPGLNVNVSIPADMSDIAA